VGPRQPVPTQSECRARTMNHQSILDEQRELWSSHPRDWAEIAEPENRKLFNELLDLAVNGFQFALDPRRAFAEAARVLVPGGRLAAATFAEPERNEGTALHLAMKA